MGYSKKFNGGKGRGGGGQRLVQHQSKAQYGDSKRFGGSCVSVAEQKGIFAVFVPPW